MNNKISSMDQLVGWHIRYRRREISLSEEELAQELSTTARMIDDYENGHVRVHTLELFKIAKILRVKTSYFFAGQSDEANRTINDLSVSQMSAEDDVRLLKLISDTKNPVFRERLFVLFQKVKKSCS